MLLPTISRVGACGAVTHSYVETPAAVQQNWGSFIEWGVCIFVWGFIYVNVMPYTGILSNEDTLGVCLYACEECGKPL